MAMDEVRYCNIHTSARIRVDCISTKLHLGDGTTLGFLPWIKEQAWRMSGSAGTTAETGTLLGDSPRTLQ